MHTFGTQFVIKGCVTAVLISETVKDYFVQIRICGFYTARFCNAKTGVYCGPLKLLAVEVFNKTNGRGIDCDLGCFQQKSSGV